MHVITGIPTNCQRSEKFWINKVQNFSCFESSLHHLIHSSPLDCCLRNFSTSSKSPKRHISLMHIWWCLMSRGEVFLSVVPVLVNQSVRKALLAYVFPSYFFMSFGQNLWWNKLIRKGLFFLTGNLAEIWGWRPVLPVFNISILLILKKTLFDCQCEAIKCLC